MKKSEIKKAKVDEWKKKEYAVLRQLIDKRRYEEALTLIACIADLEYDYNQHYYNEKLEESILEIALLKKEKIFISPVRDQRSVFFYDGFGFETRGLALIYIKALSRMFKLVYATGSEHKNNISHLEKQIKENNGTIIYLKNKKYTDRIQELICSIEQYKSQFLFMYTYPNDVVVTVAYAMYKDIAHRFQVNLTDHAFWLGNKCIDTCIEFREYGGNISRRYRKISENNIALLPFYPIVNHDEPFMGFPFKDSRDKHKIVFSGGSLYKTMDKKNEYYSFVRMLLRKYPEMIFWYAGQKSIYSKELEKLMIEFPQRVFWTQERRDLYQIMQNVDIYLNTFPISGGLMIQYAAVAGTIPIIVKYDDETLGNFLKNEDKIICNSFGEAETKIDKLFNDQLYYKDTLDLLKDTIITQRDFEEQLYSIIHSGKSIFHISYSCIDVTKQKKIYLDRFNCTGLDRYLSNKNSTILIRCKASQFAKGTLIKFFSLLWRKFRNGNKV